MSKKIGIIGGMGARAGVLLAKKIVDYSPAATDQEFPEFILHSNSKVPDRTMAILGKGISPIDELTRSIEMMNREGIDLLLIACITASYFYDSFIPVCKAEIIHPIDLLGKYLNETHPEIERVGILATTGSIKTGIFDRLCIREHLRPIYLDSHAQEDIFMNAIYGHDGLKSSSYSNFAKTKIITCADELIAKHAQIIVAGCTEVSLVLGANDFEVPYIDLLDLLAYETIERCYGKSSIKLKSILPQ